MTKANAAPMFIARPISSPSPSSFGCGAVSFCRAGIAGEIVVFNGTFNPILGHAIGISGDTESDVGGGGRVLATWLSSRNRSRDRFDNLGSQ